VALACGVVLLISAGALVKSKEAGLSVPDWPLSYGGLNPPRWWEIENVRAEHGHRLIAGTIALATVALAVWISRREPRRWVRRLGWLAVAAVFTQALLGGITVLMFLPPAVSVSHAGLAQIFLCLTVTLALATSAAWQREPALGGEGASSEPYRLATTTTALIYVQILIGAVMRHIGAGLAIPDFPLVFGGLLPPRFDWPIAVNYAHRLGAIVVAVLVLTTATRVLRRPGCPAGIRRPAAAMALLVLVQIGLGGAVILTGRAVLPNTIHVATGAALLGTSLIVTLNSWRIARSGRAGERLTAPIAEMAREGAS
jgi:cytochrome c oxidase assembly protein subunit 15